MLEKKPLLCHSTHLRTNTSTYTIVQTRSEGLEGEALRNCILRRVDKPMLNAVNSVNSCRMSAEL